MLSVWRKLRRSLGGNKGSNLTAEFRSAHRAVNAVSALLANPNLNEGLKRHPHPVTEFSRRGPQTCNLHFLGGTLNVTTPPQGKTSGSLEGGEGAYKM